MPRPKRSPRRVARAVLLGAYVRRIREEAGLSREALARSAEISTETLRKIEQGTTSSPELFTFAAIMAQTGDSIDEAIRVATAEEEEQPTLD